MGDTITKAKILIVEDEVLVGLDIKENLLALNYEIPELVVSAESALSYLENNTVDLVLMDIQLKGKMSGIEAAGIIQSKFVIPVLFTTAYATPEIIQEAREAQVYGYLLKPYKVNELHAAIEVALYKHTSEQNKQALDRQIQRAEKYASLRAMAGGIAHKFNNSIHAVLGNLSLALRSIPPESPERLFLTQAEKAAWQASEISKQMHSFSGNNHTEKIKINLSVFIEQLRHLLKAILPSNLLLDVRLSDDLPLISGDPVQLKQVVFAVMSNAIESYGKCKGTIIIKTSVLSCNKEDLIPIRFGSFLKEGSYVKLEIQDFGCGIDKKGLSKIFDPFYSTKFIGRGLGLPASLGIVQAHLGSIKVESTPSVGTSVSILIPVFSKIKPVDQKLSNFFNQKSILVVDDEEVVRLVTESMLKRAGFIVFTAANGAEALEIFKERFSEISCILLDSTMPGLGSVETIKKLNLVSPLVKVLICSGYEEEEATKGLSRDNYIAFIKKPFSMSTLIEKLSQAIC